MYTVTADYNKQMDKGIRNESYVKITFGVIDPDAPNYSTITDTGHLHYSNSASLDLGFNVSKTYQTLERNRFILNGKNPLPIRSNTLFQGFVGNKISDDNGNYSSTQGLTITFSQYVEFGGFTIKFDNTTGEYPKQFTINFYNGSSVVLNKICYPKSTTYIISDKIPICNKIIITYNKSTIPHRRARITEIIYGIVDVLTDADITGFTFSNKTDLISSTLPSYSFSFDIFDINGNYDPENPDSLFEYLETGQPVKCELGQMLDDGTIEYVPICNCFTQGEVSVSNAGFVRTISLNAGSILDLWDMEFNEDTYTQNGKTFYDLINNIANSIGYTGTITIDDDLKNYTTSIPLYGKSVKDCLQLISNASLSSLTIDRNGLVTIKRLSDNPTNYKLGFNKMYEFPKGNRTPRLRNIITTYYKNTLDSEKNKIGELTINDTQYKEYSLKFNQPYANVTYTNTGLTLNGSPKIYSNKIVFTAKGNGTFIVNGYKINKTEIIYTKKYNEIGEDLQISNELIDSEEKAEQFCDGLYDYFSRRTDYEFTDRGFPQLDLLDDITIQTNYDGEIDTTIYEHSIEYNGVISGSHKVLTKVKE